MHPVVLSYEVRRWLIRKGRDATKRVYGRLILLEDTAYLSRERNLGRTLKPSGRLEKHSKGGEMQQHLDLREILL